ncbi:MAG: hypothetical protein ICV86_15540 [Microcoleus sp. T3-bin5]|nr:hypothetical protein [Microcoleus sp. T3-bin5]
MFVRRKTVNGRTYFYLVESYRDESGKNRQRMIEYLGDYDCAVAATANQPELRAQLMQNITTQAKKRRTPPSEADKLNQAIARMQDEIDRLRSSETKRKYALEMLKQFCEIEDAKPFGGGKEKTEPAWVILHDEKPSSRWTRLAQFCQWLEKIDTGEQ